MFSELLQCNLFCHSKTALGFPSLICNLLNNVNDHVFDALDRNRPLSEATSSWLLFDMSTTVV